MKKTLQILILTLVLTVLSSCSQPSTQNTETKLGEKNISTTVQNNSSEPQETQTITPQVLQLNENQSP